MLGTRGRPRKVMPIHPNLVLTRSLRTSLSTVVYLQRAIKNKNTAHLHESSRNILGKAQKKYRKSKERGHPDFDHLAEAENNIRKNSLQMLFEIAAAYGNKEVRRVKSSDKSVGPLNQRFNIGGAVLRDFVMTTFPFPDRELLYGFTEETYGYHGDSLCHKVVPIHNLPELDFIDSCRKHVQVLNTWCYIFDVSLTDTAKYSNLFLLRARPYLERIYSENKYGKAGFREGTLKVLRDLKDDIAKHHKVRIGDTPTVTSSFEFEEPKFKVNFFKEQVREARERGIVSSTLDELDRIVNGGSIIKTILDEETLEEKPAPCLTEDDVKHIWRRLRELSGQKGTQVHRQITSLFPSHWNISRAIRFGDELGGEDGYLLISEIPVDTELGKGRIDLILLKRVITPDGLNVFWQPVFILDIKTKQGYTWDLGYETKDSASRRSHGLPLRKIPEFIISERLLNDDEWRNILEGNPDDRIVTQVNAYADAVANEFLDISQNKEPVKILKGTLFVDACDDIREIRSVIRSFVIEVFESINELDDEISRTVFNIAINQKSLKVAVLLHEQENPHTSELVSFPAPIIRVQDPFEALIGTDKEFTLYLAGETQTSGGTSAAWISKYFHGLQFVDEWKKRNRNSNILWIDLADEFIQSGFREARLYLHPRSGNFHDTARSHSGLMKNIFDSIEIVGLFDKMQDFLFRDGNIPSIQPKKVPDLIVVSGWDRLQSSVPTPYDEKFRELKANMVRNVSEDFDASVLWFDNPIPDEQNSSIYSTRTLIPYYQDSPFFGRVTQIIWNLPVAPESEILSDEWTLPYTTSVPLFDDIRVIIAQKQSGFDTELVNIPPLVGWSRKFRSDFLESELDTLLQEEVPPLGIRNKIRILSFDLVPWLLDLWPNSDGDKPTRQSLHDLKKMYRVPRNQIEIQNELLTTKLQEKGILERVKFRPRSQKSGKSYVPVAKGTINSQRLYRSSYSIKVKERSSYERSELMDSDQIEKLRFGRIYTRTSSETQDELLVIEGSKDSTMLLIGHFSESSRKDQSGFLWSDFNKDRLSTILEEFDLLEIEDLLIKTTDNQQELWQWDFDRSEWLPRSVIEILSSRTGRVGSINGIREMKFELTREISSHIGIPESFNFYARQSVYRLVGQKRMPKNVKISLEKEGAYCNVRFLDLMDNEEIHLLKIQSTPDLVNVLRLPISERKHYRTDKGELVIWNPFTDIEYREFELIRPFIETNAPREVGIHLPQKIDGLMESKEEGTLHLVLSHDNDSCPLVLGTGLTHGSCWIIRSEDDSVNTQLFKNPMSGREIFGQLAAGKIDAGQVIYNIEISLEYDFSSREFYVYYEDDWIRRVLRRNDIYLKKLTPGTYLRDDERWIIEYSIQGNYIQWVGISSLTDIHWKDRIFQFQLNPSLNLRNAKDEFLNSITDEISSDIILNLHDINIEIETILSNRGYGEIGPQCFLSISRNGNEFTITLAEENEMVARIISKDTFRIESTENREAVLEGFYGQFDSGELSEYNIANGDEFMQELETLLDEIGLHDNL
ncbi:hypothetical protein EU528_03380 [Candidatus Thorarchaeota archaeon]|nr:MAG: hypothetical protein EU528_03380 [Candidatus Thorarchaeota archaeon]